LVTPEMVAQWRAAWHFPASRTDVRTQTGGFSMQKPKRLAAMLVLGVAASFALSQSAFAYGALAIQSNHGGAIGWSYSYNTKADAEDRALSECGDDCTVVLDFWNGCAAYSSDQDQGSSVYGWGTGTTQRAAERTALEECEGHGGTSCIIKVWACE
jgi:hypothetical protein